MTIDLFFYGLLSLFFIVVLIFSPLIRKSIDKKRKKDHDEKSSNIDSFNKSLDSHNVASKLRTIHNANPQSNYQYKVLDNGNSQDKKNSNTSKRIEDLSRLKKAVIWSEILSKPKGLKN